MVASDRGLEIKLSLQNSSESHYESPFQIPKVSSPKGSISITSLEGWLFLSRPVGLQEGGYPQG